ncbi:MAG: DUF2062 domain-containing protein [Cephaloticoccus sp.]|nr:DUF2062 domain-containing protein [Cephaloticoccus sp.]
MNPASDIRTDSPSAPRRSFWQRRVLDPVVAQLTQGIGPEKIALTFAVGVAGGLFPFLGLTTLLCFLLALAFRLNQPLIHVINQLLWPVHLTMVVVYIKAGAWIYGATALPFDPEEVTRLFMHSQREFWGRFGLMGLHALTSWLLTVPVIVAGIYFPLRPALRRLNQTRRKTSVP